MDKSESESFLHSLLNKNFRVLATDGRIFRGQFKCTDPDRNIVLSHTYEFRRVPTSQAKRDTRKAEQHGAAPPSTAPEAGATTTTPSDDDSRKTNASMASRYLGLVVVPGQYIVKMEVEEFLSQSGASRPYSIPVGTTTRGSVSVEVSTSTAVGSASELSPRQPLGVSSSVVARAGPLAVSSVVTDDDTAVPVTIRTAPAPALESPVLGTAAVGEGDDMEGIR